SALRRRPACATWPTASSSARRPRRPRRSCRSCGAAAPRPPWTVSAALRHMPHRFIVAETPKEATKILQELWRSGAATSVDLLGEATVTSAEADRYAQRCAQGVDQLAGG